MTETTSTKNLVLIITTTVYSFSSMISAFFMLGSRSLLWLLISAFCYFIPYALIVAQYTKKYSHKSGSIYIWLKDSLSPRSAFITIFLWYCSYFIWMISLFMKVLIPLSILLFGKDITTTIDWFGIPSNVWLALFSIIAVAFITWINQRGFHVIFTLLRVSGYLMVGLLLLSFIGNFALISKNPDQVLLNLHHSFSIDSFFSNSSSRLLSQLPFFIFSITAFGGLDTVASLADKTKNSRSIFPRSIIVSALFIFLLYVFGIILWSGANDIERIRDIQSLNLGNLMYGVMDHLARSLAETFHFTSNQAYLIRQIFIRFTAITMGSAYISLLCSISYGPLTSLIESIPKKAYPKLFKLNKNQMPETVLWIQGVSISCCIVFLSLNNNFFSDLFNQLTYMTNVSRAIPYFVVAASFPLFLKKGIINKQALLVKNLLLNYLFSMSVCVCIFVAISFQIYEPLKLGNYLNFFTLLLGPTLFSLLASIIYFRMEQKKGLVTVGEKNKN